MLIYTNSRRGKHNVGMPNAQKCTDKNRQLIHALKYHSKQNKKVFVSMIKDFLDTSVNYFLIPR